MSTRPLRPTATFASQATVVPEVTVLRQGAEPLPYVGTTKRSRVGQGLRPLPGIVTHATLGNRRSPLFGLLLLFLFGSALPAAAAVQIDARPLFGDTLVEGCWQPVAVTLTNSPGSEAVQGEVRLTLENSRTGLPLAVYARPIALPAGAGSTQTILYVRTPGGVQPEITVGVTAGADLITQRHFDKIAYAPETPTLVAVTPAPDTLSRLQGADLGVFQENGALRPASGTKTRLWTTRGPGARRAVTTARIAWVSGPGSLPDRSAGYDTVGAIYLGDAAPPAAYSDTQVQALNAFATSGGLIIADSVAAARLRADERFRPLLPAPPVENAAPFSRIGIGRGHSVSLAPNTAPDSPALWRPLLLSAVAPPRIGQGVQGGGGWQGGAFEQAVLHAPGLRAPSPTTVGLFLLGYVILLVPVNFLLLRRLRRPEWAWITVPVLVVAGSFAMYGIGYAVKGGELLVNVASIAEMRAGSGTASVSSAIGLFSPARRRYAISLETPDALLVSEARMPGVRRRRNGGDSAATAAPPPTVEIDAGQPGARIRDAEIAMWAMRTFRARTDTLTLGQGIKARLWEQDGKAVGSLQNRTGRTLRDVVVYGPGGRQEIGDVGPDETRSVQFALEPANRGQRTDWSAPLGRFNVPPLGMDKNAPQAVTARLGAAITREVSQAISTLLTERRAAQAQDHRAGAPGPILTIAAWSTDPLLPLRVNGRPLTRGAQVTLLLSETPLLRPGQATETD